MLKATTPTLYSDLIYSILLFSPPSVFLKTSRVCKLWRRTLNQPNFCKEYICLFFKLDSNAIEYLEYLFANNIFENDRVGLPFRLQYSPCLVPNNYQDVLQLLAEVYIDFDECLREFQNVIDSLDRKMFGNEQYVKNTLKRFSLIRQVQQIPKIEISFMDLDDILFRIKNCRVFVYSKDGYILENTWDFILFTFCGFPISVTVSQTSITINNVEVMYWQYSRFWLVSKNINMLESIFNIQYEPVGYCGIDETFTHESILEVIIIELFQQILSYSPCSYKGETEEVQCNEYRFFEVPIMKDLILDIKSTFGPNSYKKTKIKKPEKKKIVRTKISLSELLN